ncbi:MAG: DUF2065 domain-containing protein [Gammaproteobacteria bacterium]|nr:DUF2065 domain-containing protein [Gammaproteobacteria bacterium]
MWQQFLIGLALVFVIEGILYFLNPQGMKNMMKAMLEMDEGILRKSGFVSMMVGLALLYLVN